MMVNFSNSAITQNKIDNSSYVAMWFGDSSVNATGNNVTNFNISVQAYRPPMFLLENNSFINGSGGLTFDSIPAGAAVELIGNTFFNISDSWCIGMINSLAGNVTGNNLSIVWAGLWVDNSSGISAADNTVSNATLNGLAILSSNSMSFSNFTITDSGSAMAPLAAGIMVASSDDINLSRMNLTRGLSLGLWIDHANRLSTSDLAVSNFTNQSAIGAGFSNDLMFSNITASSSAGGLTFNTVSRANVSGVSFYDVPLGASITLSDNISLSSILANRTSQIAVDVVDSSGISIDNSSVQNAGTGFQFQSSQGITASRCNFSLINLSAFSLLGVSDADLSNFSIKDAGLNGTEAAFIASSSNITLRDSPNSITYSGSGIMVGDSDAVTISNVRLANLNASTISYSDANYSGTFNYSGIYSMNSNVSISGCVIDSNSGSGILAISDKAPATCTAINATALPSISVTGTNITNNAGDGITLLYSNLVLSGSLLSGNAMNGLFAWGFGNANITGNDVKTNGGLGTVLVEDGLISGASHSFTGNNLESDSGGIGLLHRLIQRCDWNWNYSCYLSDFSGNTIGGLQAGLVSVGCLDNGTNTYLPATLAGGGERLTGWISQIHTIDPLNQSVGANVTVWNFNGSIAPVATDANASFDTVDFGMFNYIDMATNISLFVTSLPDATTRRFIVYQDFLDNSNNDINYTPQLLRGVRNVTVGTTTRLFRGTKCVPYYFSKPVELMIPTCPSGPSLGSGSGMVYSTTEAYLFNGSAWENSPVGPLGSEGFVGSQSTGNLSVLVDLYTAQIYDATTHNWTQISNFEHGVVEAKTSNSLVAVVTGTGVYVYDATRPAVSPAFWSAGSADYRILGISDSAVAAVKFDSSGIAKSIQIYSTASGAWQDPGFGNPSGGFTLGGVSNNYLVVENHFLDGTVYGILVYDFAHGAFVPGSPSGKLRVRGVSDNLIAAEHIDSGGIVDVVYIFDSHRGVWDSLASGAYHYNVLGVTESMIPVEQIDGSDVVGIQIYDIKRGVWDSIFKGGNIAKFRVSSPSKNLVAAEGLTSAGDVVRVSVYNSAKASGSNWDSYDASGLITKLHLFGLSPLLVAVEGMDSGGIIKSVTVYIATNPTWQTISAQGIITSLRVADMSYYLVGVEGNQSDKVKMLYVYDATASGGTWNNAFVEGTYDHSELFSVTDLLVAANSHMAPTGSSQRVAAYDLSDHSWHYSPAITTNGITCGSACTRMIVALQEDSTNLNTSMWVYESSNSAGWMHSTNSYPFGLSQSAVSLKVALALAAGVSGDTEWIESYDPESDSFQAPTHVFPPSEAFIQLSSGSAIVYTDGKAYAYKAGSGSAWTVSPSPSNSLENGVLCPWANCGRCSNSGDCPPELPVCDDGRCIPICGDAFCDASIGENCSTCAIDCGACPPPPPPPIVAPPESCSVTISYVSSACAGEEVSFTTSRDASVSVSGPTGSVSLTPGTEFSFTPSREGPYTIFATSSGCNIDSRTVTVADCARCNATGYSCAKDSDCCVGTCCGGRCADLCSSPLTFNPSTCSCACANTCNAPLVLNPAKCSCDCALISCSSPLSFDSKSCSCICPAGVDCSQKPPKPPLQCANGKVLNAATGACECPAGTEQVASTDSCVAICPLPRARDLLTGICGCENGLTYNKVLDTCQTNCQTDSCERSSDCCTGYCQEGKCVLPPNSTEYAMGPKSSANIAIWPLVIGLSLLAAYGAKGAGVLAPTVVGFLPIVISLITFPFVGLVISISELIGIAIKRRSNTEPDAKKQDAKKAEPQKIDAQKRAEPFDSEDMPESP